MMKFDMDSKAVHSDRVNAGLSMWFKSMVIQF